MAISLEVLNTTFAQFKGPLQRSVLRRLVLLEALRAKARVVSEGGTYIERAFTGGSPAQVVGIYDGSELLDLTRRPQKRKYSVEPHRVVGMVTIPKKDLLLNTGKAKVIELITGDPKDFVDHFDMDLESYLFTGQALGLAATTDQLLGFTNLNGNFTSGIGQGVLTGFLSFATPALQTAVTQNLAKAESYGHYNHYAAPGSWALGGYKAFKKLYRKAAHYSGKPNKGPDLIFMDEDSFSNLEETKQSPVRTAKVTDATETDATMELMHMGARVICALSLDRTNVTAFPAAATGASGVTMMLNTDFMEYVIHQEPTMGQFEDKFADQDVIGAKFEFMGQLIINKFTAHAIMSGTGI